MYAIIRAGGHQEKVTAGEVITLDRRKEAVGDQVTFVPLMISKEDGTVVSDRKTLGDGDAKVVATVLKHVKADKVDVFTYRNKTGYRRHTGHRQPVTLLEISEIRYAGEVVTAPEPEPEQQEPAEAATPTKKTTAKKKTATKTTGKKTTAKKTTAKKTTAKKPAATEPAATEEPGAEAPAEGGSAPEPADGD